MDFWYFIAEVTLLLGSAFVLGALAQGLKQSAILGYLLAGTFLGPLLFNKQAVVSVAELGVALLLFSIGLEFSLRRLKSMGAFAIFGGMLQVLLTLAVFTVLFKIVFPLAVSLALGAMVSLSSTAIVLRMLVDRSEIDSSRGRNALSILLLQDIAVVPLVLGVTLLSRGGNLTEVVLQVIKTIGAAAGLVLVFYLLFFHLIPKMLKTTLFANRELVVLLTIVLAVGATWASHALGLSPALGAFLAGILLAESPFAVQIRSDIGSIRVLFVTLFFTSIGMLANPVWFLGNWPKVLLWLGLILIGKTLIIYMVSRLFKMGHRISLATGITLAQVGEFSFVLAAIAESGGLISADVFALMISVTILSMFLAPYMVSCAEPLVASLFRSSHSAHQHPKATSQQSAMDCARRTVIIGFGPAGQEVASALQAEGYTAEIVELNPASASKATEKKLTVHIGDASSGDLLEHFGLGDAGMVVITIPDPRTARNIITMIRHIAPDAKIIARSRYHLASADLHKAGADITVDEEQTVGINLAREALTVLQEGQIAAMACALAAKKPEPHLS